MLTVASLGWTTVYSFPRVEPLTLENLSDKAGWKSFHPGKTPASRHPSMCPTVIIGCFPWFFLLSPCHRTHVGSSRWELTQLFPWMTAIVLFCFLLTLLSLFIPFLLCLDKKVIYSYLWAQFSCWSSVILFLLHIMIISLLYLKLISSIPMLLG